MTIKRLTLIVAAVFLLLGIAGFITVLAPVSPDTGEAYLLGLFAVNPLHNWVHILSGIVAILAALSSDAMCRLYYKVFGIVYALVTLIGLVVGHRAVMGMALNLPDTVLHLVLAAGALYLGFSHHLPGWVQTDSIHPHGGSHA